MKRSIFKTLTLIGTIFSITACQFATARYEPESTLLRSAEDVGPYYNWKDYANDEKYREFVSKMKLFSSSLSESLAKYLYEGDKNITFSPLSIALTLGIAAYSTTGPVRQQILDAFDMDFETLDKYYRVYFDSLGFEKYDKNDRLSSKLSLTNSIWLSKNMKDYYKEQGLDDLKNNYFCYSFEADFQNNPYGSAEAIRQFIKEHTNGLIDKDIKIDKLLWSLIINTVYLKDVWDTVNHELGFTDDKYTFKNGDNTKKETYLLYGASSDGRAIETETYSSFFTSTYYGFTINFIKPNDGYKITDVFTEENINYVTNSNNYVYQSNELMEKYHTRCLFPEFSAESDFTVDEVLKEDFGIKISSALADNISEVPGKIGNMIHAAKLEVNQKGIEGAAITTSGTYGSMMEPQYKDVYENFIVDKEFGFVIRSGSAIILSGIVSKI